MKDALRCLQFQSTGGGSGIRLAFTERFIIRGNHTEKTARLRGSLILLFSSLRGAEYKWSSYGEYIGESGIVEREFTLKMFSDRPGETIKMFEKYSREESKESCLEIEEPKVLTSDDDLRKIVRQQFGTEAIDVCNQAREKQDSIVQKMRKINGVNIRQIARVTGLSQTRVWRAWNKEPVPLFWFSDRPGETIKMFEKYSREESKESCLEIEEPKVLTSDDDLREIVRQQFGTEAIDVCN
jgi:hypothetical protein